MTQKEEVLQGTVCSVEKKAKSYRAFDINSGKDLTSEIWNRTRKQAFENGKYLLKKGKRWVQVSPSEIKPKSENGHMENHSNISEMKSKYPGVFESHESEKIREFISKSVERKPHNLIMKELTWKYLVRSALRGKNIMLVGYSGCGKTLSAQSLAQSLDRPYYYFNMGATQDPIGTLVGDTVFKKDTGTLYQKSRFIEAITTPYSVVLLDELSRANPEAWNILMTTLDYNQRYIPIDQGGRSEIINVAEGVTFIATANIGSEFTSTRIMDRAMMDRFVIVEVPLLDENQEKNLIKLTYPEIQDDVAEAISKIATMIRQDFKSEDAKLSTLMSTRMAVEMSGLIMDGFSLREAAETSLIPFFPDDAGSDSERAHVRIIVNKFTDMKNDEEVDEEDEDLFNLDDLE